MKTWSKALALCLAVALLSTIPSCADTKQVDRVPGFLYNSTASPLFSGSDNYVFLNTDQPYFIDKASGTVRPLILDPLDRLVAKDYGDAIVGNDRKFLCTVGNKAYILENDYSALGIGSASFELSCVDLKSFDKTTVIQVGTGGQDSSFLGLKGLFSNSNPSSHGYFDDSDTGGSARSVLVSHYFVLGNNLYTVENNSLCRRNLATGACSVLTDDLNLRLALSCDGEYIYYLSSSYTLKKLSLQDGSVDTLIDTSLEGLYVSTDFVYYEDIVDGHSLYRYDKVNGRTKKILDSPANGIQEVGAYLYYLDSDWKLKRLPLEGGESEPVSDQEMSDFYIDAETSTIYYETIATVDGETANVYYRMDSSGQAQILDVSLY